MRSVSKRLSRKAITIFAFLIHRPQSRRPCASTRHRLFNHAGPNEALDLRGTIIPAKYLVVPVVFLIHRDARIWHNPERFNPERFAPGGESSKVHPFAYFPFSAGLRACTGAGLAPFVLQEILTKMLARYKISSRPRSTADPALDFGFGIPPKNGLHVAIAARHISSRRPGSME